ncbi:hypothetical protein ILYODFUR_014606 [Ilyodon furcidens]|uniref:Uncharacterized protein n=1 Tax=Ilyodon furcidens TaxID=33524 RepID=A0ABV0UIV7_9TELE
MPETPQLTPLDVEKQKLYSKLLTNSLTLSLRECPATLPRKLISAACILGYRSFGHDSRFMPIGEGLALCSVLS